MANLAAISAMANRDFAIFLRDENNLIPHIAWRSSTLKVSEELIE